MDGKFQNNKWIMETDIAINKNQLEEDGNIELKPKVICDTAHNYDAIKNVLKELTN